MLFSFLNGHHCHITQQRSLKSIDWPQMWKIKAKTDHHEHFSSTWLQSHFSFTSTYNCKTSLCFFLKEKPCCSHLVLNAGLLELGHLNFLVARPLVLSSDFSLPSDRWCSSGLVFPAHCIWHLDVALRNLLGTGFTVYTTSFWQHITTSSHPSTFITDPQIPDTLYIYL